MKRYACRLARIIGLQSLLIASMAAGSIFAADEIHWTFTGQTSVTVDWRGSSSENTIRYGAAAGTYTTTVTAVAPTAPNIPFSSAGPFWEAKITGLVENTTYHYSIAGGPDHTFHTPLPRGSTAGFTVYVEGDIGDASSYARMPQVQSLITGPDFVFPVGDLDYANAHGLQHVDAFFNDIMVWSQDTGMMPAWGNHEWDSPTNACGGICGSSCSTQVCDDLRNYKGRFDLPNPRTSPGSPSVSCCGEDWYWFDYGNIRFIAYPEPFSGAFADWNTQAKTLMDAAQADPAITFIVTFGHRPAYSSGHHSGDTALKGYIDGLGATHSKYVLNLNGHSHNYERTFPQSGVTHLTVGTGGGNMEQDGTCLWATCTQPTWSAFRAFTLGVMKLRFSGTSIQGSFLCGPSGGGTNEINGVRTTCTQGSVVDSFTIGTTAPPDTTPPTVSVTAPAAGTTVSGTTVSLTATASDNVGVAGVQFKLDGVNLGAEDTSSPYTVSWNTTTAANGAHSITAMARDAAGNSTLSAAISVIVNNSTATLITNASLVFSVPAVGRPGYLAPFADPTFGTTITRIADDPAKPLTWTGPPSGSGTWGSDARHHYSKDQPWSSDGALLVLQNSGSPSQVILDGNTYLPRYGKCGNYSVGDDRWHPATTHPHERINANGTRLEWFDVTTCTQTRVWTLPFAVDFMGSGEGNPSRDGRFVALADATRVFVVDMDPQSPLQPYPNVRIGPALDVSACGLSTGCTLDWVSISASGTYLVVDYLGQHPRVFDINPTTLALTPRVMPSGSPRCSGGAASQGYIYDLGHADLTLNPFDNNEDVLVGQEHCGNSGSTLNGTLIGGVVLVRLRDGVITSLTDPTNEAYPHHISARNINRPGWVFVGYQPASGKRFNDEIVALKMDGTGAVERLAHKHSVFSGCYRCESHSVPSLDGRRVVFASNWAASCGSLCGSTSEIEDYVVDTRSIFVPDTTPPAAPTGVRIVP